MLAFPGRGLYAAKAVDLTPLHDRLHAVVGPLSFRRLAELTGTNAETVRRYMHGQSPSVEFLTALCAKLDVSPEWLLTGRGARHASKAREQVIRDANPSELLGAMAATVERLAERVQRLELFIQSLDSRLRVALEASPGASYEHAETIQPAPIVVAPGARAGPDPRAHPAAERALGVAGALAQRPRSPDG